MRKESDEEGSRCNGATSHKQHSGLHLSGRGSAWLERLVRDQEVGGSNPLAPTTFFKDLRANSVFSSAGGADNFVANKSRPGNPATRRFVRTPAARTSEEAGFVPSIIPLCGNPVPPELFEMLDAERMKSIQLHGRRDWFTCCQNRSSDDARLQGSP